MSSEKGTHDGLSCEIPRTPDIPAGATGRDDYRDTDRGDNSEAPVAPSKLSAQEWLDKEFPSSAQSSMLERSFACRVAEAYARKYASSSNAALRDELSKAKQIIHVNVGGQIYERLLEALKMLEPLDEPGQPNTLVALVGKALERMREAESKVTALEGQLREAREIERGLVRQVEHYQKKAVLGDPKV